jgi:hypothetical protein
LAPPGKSSFLRARVLPRLKRDDRHFLPLPVIRPERAAISGATGLLRALEGALDAARMTIARADLRAAIDGGAATLKPLLLDLATRATPIAPDAESKPKPPVLVLAIDQAEELFLAEALQEGQRLLALLHDLLIEDPPAIRSDNYERLQLARELEGVRQAWSTPTDNGGASAPRWSAAAEAKRNPGAILPGDRDHPFRHPARRGRPRELHRLPQRRLAARRDHRPGWRRDCRTVTG